MLIGRLALRCPHLSTMRVFRGSSVGLGSHTDVLLDHLPFDFLGPVIVAASGPIFPRPLCNPFCNAPLRSQDYGMATEPSGQLPYHGTIENMTGIAMD